MTMLILLTPISIALAGAFLLAAGLEFTKTYHENKSNGKLIDNNFSITFEWLLGVFPFTLILPVVFGWKQNPTGRKYTYFAAVNSLITALVFYYA